MIVLDHEYHGQVPQFGHIVGLVDLALVGVPEISEGHPIISKILIRKSEARTQRNLCCNNAMPAVKMLFLREHVHGATLALGVAALAPCKLGHHPVGIHAAGQHMAMVSVRCDALVTFFGSGFQAHDNGLLTDVEVAKAPDETHAIKLTGLLFETPDQQHVLVIRLEFLGGDIGLFCRFSRCHQSHILSLRPVGQIV